METFQLARLGQECSVHIVVVDAPTNIESPTVFAWLLHPCLELYSSSNPGLLSMFDAEEDGFPKGRVVFDLVDGSQAGLGNRATSQNIG